MANGSKKEWRGRSRKWEDGCFIRKINSSIVPLTLSEIKG